MEAVDVVAVVDVDVVVVWRVGRGSGLVEKREAEEGMAARSRLGGMVAMLFGWEALLR